MYKTEYTYIVATKRIGKPCVGITSGLIKRIHERKKQTCTLKKFMPENVTSSNGKKGAPVIALRSNE